MRRRVDAVLCGQEHGAGRKHDGGIVDHPGVVEGDEVVDGLLHERMALLGKHEVIGNANGDCFGKYDGELEQGIHRAQTADVEVHVDSSITVEHEVANSVRALNWILIVVECFEKPGIVLCEERPGGVVCPKHVFVVWHHITTGLGNGLPSTGQDICFPGLVNDSWDAFGGVVVDYQVMFVEKGFWVDGEVISNGREDNNSAEKEYGEESKGSV